MYKENHIVLFDGVCVMCNSLMQFVIKRDQRKSFSFAAMQTGKGQRLLKESILPEGYIDSVVYVKDGKYLYKSTAVLNILHDLGGIWKMVIVFILIPPVIRDSFYNIVARNRYRFLGKLNSCMVPNDEILDRFLQ